MQTKQPVTLKDLVTMRDFWKAQATYYDDDTLPKSLQAYCAVKRIECHEQVERYEAALAEMN